MTKTSYTDNTFASSPPGGKHHQTAVKSEAKPPAQRRSTGKSLKKAKMSSNKRQVTKAKR